jgi:hypothetical protein
VIKESEFKLDPSRVTIDKPGTYICIARWMDTGLKGWKAR